MNLPTNIQIVVVSRQPGTDVILHKIRRWTYKSRHSTYLLGTNIKVERETTLPAAMRDVRHSHDKSILIPIGFPEGEVTRLLTSEEKHHLEVIIRPPRPGLAKELNESPSSSLLENTHLVNVQDTIPAIQKSITRLRLKDSINIATLDDKEQLREYFALRYRVWKKMGYLAPEKDSSKSAWEIDFTDRTALPIGAFTHDGKLIGCARLVFPSHGKFRHLTRMIDDLIKERNDPILTRNYQQPKNLMHPFDLLESFDEFARFYAEIVRSRQSKAEVSRVIVDNKYRNQGIGEVLVDSLLSIARQNKVKILFLACVEEHRHFYESCGFNQLKHMHCENFSNVNVPAIAMTCNLNKLKQHQFH